MDFDQSLPFFLWVEACCTVVYNQNRSPHRAVGNMTPEECFSGKKPEVSHFWMFGNLTYSHVPSEEDKVGAQCREGHLCGL